MRLPGRPDCPTGAAAQRDARRVDVRARREEVDDGRDHVLPVGTERNLADEQLPTLARPVEEQRVVSGLDGRGAAERPHVDVLRVAAVLDDDGRSRTGDTSCLEEVAVQRPASYGICTRSNGGVSS